MSRELVDTLRLAVPMALTQLGQIAMMTTDLALIGRLGEAAVAAAALASTVYFISFTFGLGVVSAVAPLAAQAFGAGDAHRVRRALRVGLWAALVISLPMIAFPLYGERILLALGQARGAVAARAAISVRRGVGRDTGAVADCAARLHGRAQSSRTGAVDHACRDPRQCGSGLSPDPRPVGAAAARPVRRRSCHLDRQLRHVPGGAVVRHAAPALCQIPCARPSLAYRLGHDAPVARDRRADLARLPDGIRPVLHGLPPQRPDQHHGIGRAPDRAAGRGHSVHGTVRHRHGGDDPRRTRRRPQRRRSASGAPASPPPCSGSSSASSSRLRSFRAGSPSPGFSWVDGSADTIDACGDAAPGRHDLLRHRRAAGRRRRRAAGPQGYADAAAVRRDRLLGHRLFRSLGARLQRRTWRGRRLDRPVDRNHGLCRHF